MLSDDKNNLCVCLCERSNFEKFFVGKIQCWSILNKYILGNLKSIYCMTIFICVAYELNECVRTCTQCAHLISIGVDGRERTLAHARTHISILKINLPETNQRNEHAFRHRNDVHRHLVSLQKCKLVAIFFLYFLYFFLHFFPHFFFHCYYVVWRVNMLSSQQQQQQKSFNLNKIQ